MYTCFLKYVTGLSPKAFYLKFGQFKRKHCVNIEISWAGHILALKPSGLINRIDKANLGQRNSANVFWASEFSCPRKEK